MENSLKYQLLSKIELIYTKAENCKLENLFFKEVDKELEFLATYFHTTKIQAFFVSIIFTVNFRETNVTFESLSNHLNCSPLKLLMFSDDFSVLTEKRLLFKKSESNLYRKNLKFENSNDEFYINKLVVTKILDNEVLPEILIDSQKFENIFSLLEKIDEIAEQRDNDEIKTRELLEQTEDIINENKHLPLINQVKTIGSNIDDKFIFLYLVWNYIDGEKDPFFDRVFKVIYDKPFDRFKQTQSFISNKNSLIKENWLEIKEVHFINDSAIVLTDKSLELLNDCEIRIFSKSKTKKENILIPEEIPFRNLIYSENETQQLDLLRKLLKEENFKNTQEKLLAKALPKGVTVLLHGIPGTGKTESVLQIAKASHREIMKVDISTTRSMWFGESEKIIKQVFKDYKEYAYTKEQMPILFINEADAILSKRKEGNASNVVDTENRIQNILLEEIENFEGILIAATNLATNIDTAFERRFLFKINFQKPSISAKSKIWKSKLANLSIENCDLLASQFDFSGGQIDNIVRKSEINEIIYGQQADINILLDFCREETLSNKGKTTIGFKKN